MTRSAAAALAGVLAVAAFLQLTALGRAPARVSTDEARVAVQARLLADTGRDMSGHRLPPFFRIKNPLVPDDPNVTWWQPALFYLDAAALRVAPFSAATVRLPIALLAVLDVWLMFLVARRLFGSDWYGLLAALMLALTPAHFIFGRQAFDYFCPLPVTLAWLWCLLQAIESDANAWPAAAGFVLGAGSFSYITSWFVMPCYLVVTLIALGSSGRPARALAAAAVGFAAPLLVAVPWLWTHPAMPREVFADYRVKVSAPLVSRLDVYWDYFNPSYLFFSGGSNPMFATRRAGVFPLAAAALLPCGLWSICARRRSIARMILLVGFLFAPVPIVLAMPTDPKYFTARELAVVPFGVLIGVAGVEWLVAARRPAARVAAALLIASLPVQFALFARTYFTTYQDWSADRFDALDFAHVAAAVAAQDAAAPVPRVYLSDTLGEEKVVQWQFHLLAAQRSDLWSRTSYLHVPEADRPRIASGSLLILGERDRPPAGWSVVDRGATLVLRRD